MNNLISIPKIEFIITDGEHSKLGHEWHEQNYTDQYSRLFYAKKGCGFIELDNRRYTMLPDRLFLIPAYTTFNYFCDDYLELTWIHFSALAFGTVSLFDLHPIVKNITLSDRDSTLAKLTALIKVIKDQSIAARLKRQGLLMQLIAPFFDVECDTITEKRLKMIHQFKPVLQYIDRHLTAKLTVESIAKKAGYQKNYFAALFKESFGMPPSQYIHKKRIERAQAILHETDDRLEMIAANLGYSDAFHFSRTFKKQTGSTPQEFRKRQRYFMP